jgi:rhodanese-related sulfurtransferase/CBS domain-containing protein
MTTRVELAALERLLDQGAQLVEVLPEAEYAEAHLPGAVNIPLKRLDREAAEALDRERPVVVYCYDCLCDLSPRAACQLETLGFTRVYDYTPGKIDWLAHNLPVERERPVAIVGEQLRLDVVRSALADPVTEVGARIDASPYGFAVVLSATGVVLGRLRASDIRAHPEGSAEELMERGPRTFRPDTTVAELLQRLRDRDLATAIVTTPDGELLGVVLRSDLEPNAGAEGAHEPP